MGYLEDVYDHILDQFSDVPNWQKYYTIFCEHLDEITTAAIEYSTRRWLETAEDHWLDICGVIIGLPRPEGWVTTGLFTWDSAVVGERWDEGVWSGSTGIKTGNLVDDDTYRPLLRAKAIANGANGSLYDIARVIDAGWGIDYTIDTSDARVVSIMFNETVSIFDRYYIKAIAPVQGDTTLIFTN